MKNLSRALLTLFNRRLSYRSIFLDEFGRPKREAKVALADLKRFCYADQSTAQVSPIAGKIDPVAMGMAEGRREVWRRIQHYLHMDEETILKLRENDNDTN